MNDSTLIRIENLKALNMQPAELAQRLGSTKQHWSNVMRGKTAFGEKLARRIEDGLELTRGAMDEPSGVDEGSIRGLTLSDQTVTEDNNASSGAQRIPLKMAYSPSNLSSTILLLGSLLGALDQRSRKMIGLLLNDLAESPDDAQDVADKASALATTQRAVTRNKALNKALTSNKDAFETGPASLEEK